MRVVFLMPDLPLAGAATRTVNLAEQLVGLGVSVEVATLLRHVDAGLEARLWLSGIAVLRLSGRADVRKLRQVLRTDPGVVIHAAMPTAGLVGLLLTHVYARHLVYTYTNCLHTQRSFRRLSLLDRVKAALERLMAGRADALHTVSDSIAEQVRQQYPFATERIHPIVDLATLPVRDAVEPGRARSQLAGGYPRLLAVGRLEPHKRFGDTVKAIASVRTRWPDIRLVVLGAGPELPRIRGLVDELGLGANVDVAGESTSPDRYFAWADLLVHPSLYEGLPRVAAEAFAVGLPIVSVDTPYGRELSRARAGTLLARPCDSESLATTILAALTRHPRLPVRLDGSDTAREFLRLYSRVLTSPRRRAGSVTKSNTTLLPGEGGTIR